MCHNNSITLFYILNVMFQPTDYLVILHSYRNWTLQVFSVDQECELLPSHYIEMDGLGVICMIMSFREIIGCYCLEQQRACVYIAPIQCNTAS